MLDMGLPYRLLYMWFTAMNARVKYYIAWILAYLVCNASGLGFNGYDINGQPKWDGLTNINIYNFEVRIISNYNKERRKSILSEILFFYLVWYKHENGHHILEYTDTSMASTCLLRSFACIQNIWSFCTECIMAWILSGLLLHVYFGGSMCVCWTGC